MRHKKINIHHFFKIYKIFSSFWVALGLFLAILIIYKLIWLPMTILVSQNPWNNDFSKVRQSAARVRQKCGKTESSKTLRLRLYLITGATLFLPHCFAHCSQKICRRALHTYTYTRRSTKNISWLQKGKNEEKINIFRFQWNLAK